LFNFKFKDKQVSTTRPETGTMTIKGRNNENFHFGLEYQDDAELTGYIWQTEITRLCLYLNMENFQTRSSILVADVHQLIEWFEQLSKDKIVEPEVLILNNQLCFDLLKNNSNTKLIRVTYDSTVPIPGQGAFQLSPGARKEDFSKKNALQCEMDQIAIESVVTELKDELQAELEKGRHIESKKPKKNP
jgi:hypothetical protein